MSMTGRPRDDLAAADDEPAGTAATAPRAAEGNPGSTAGRPRSVHPDHATPTDAGVHPDPASDPDPTGPEDEREDPAVDDQEAQAAPPPRRRHRWRWLGRILLPVALLAIVTVAVYQLQAVDWARVLSDARWEWVLVAVVFSAVSYLGAAWNVLGFSPARIGLFRAYSAQMAGAAMKIITPAGVGALAVNVRLVQKAGASTKSAVTAIAGSQGAQFLVSVLAIGLLVFLPGPGVRLPEVPRSPWVWGAAALGVVVAVGTFWVVWHTREPVRRQVRDALAAMRRVVVSPRRFAEGFGGGLLVTAGFVGALWGCTVAFGGGVSLLGAGVVVLVATGVGSIVPTPGGAGAVEVSLTTALVAVGASLAVAVPAVLVYRLVTFWLPMLVGLAAAARLRSLDAL